MASKVALAVDRKTRGELVLKHETENYSCTKVSGIEKGNREDHIDSLSAVHYNPIFFLS